MGFRESVSYFDRGHGGALGTAVGKSMRYRYQQAAFALERALLNDRLLYEYRVAMNQRGVFAPADPRELRYVDPGGIREETGFHPHFCWRKIGAVKGGDWDVNRLGLLEKPFFREIYDALLARYVAGKPWEEITLVQEVLREERHWHHHIGEEVWDWCNHLDRLYESMQTEGYLSQREVYRMSFSEACESDSVSIIDWMDDIRIDIGRDGQLLRHDGKHRLWLAELLGIERIPVCVVVRHRRWQALRDEVARADHVDELSDDALRHLDHPDMVDVRAELAGMVDVAEEPEVPSVTATDGGR